MFHKQLTSSVVCYKSTSPVMTLEWEEKTSSNTGGEQVVYDERASEKVKTPKGHVEVLESHVRVHFLVDIHVQFWKEEIS